VDIAFQKTAFSQVSTTYASTFTTLANQYQLGLTQEFSNAPNLNPMIQQLEIIQIQVLKAIEWCKKYNIEINKNSLKALAYHNQAYQY